MFVICEKNHIDINRNLLHLCYHVETINNYNFNIIKPNLKAVQHLTTLVRVLLSSSITNKELRNINATFIICY